MMMSPAGFRLEHEEDTFEELLKVRDELIKDIWDYEHNEPSEEAWLIHPSPDTVYHCNLEYLAEICKLISKKYKKEV